MLLSQLRVQRCTLAATVVIWLISLAHLVNSQNCSETNHCASGCCSKDGYCGIGDSYCSEANCVSTCMSIADDGTQCDENRHCKEGCCSKFGVCGYGPDYCGKTCLSTCDAKAECDPGNFGPEYVKSSRCPLNVCCSEYGLDPYGFCGTTKDFCGVTKVKRPSCSQQATTIEKVVGYYEGWMSNRACNKFWPEKIPRGVYTHLNYAFAAIHPQTFEVVLPNHEIALLTRLVNRKRYDRDLKVNIAIGGWTYNDPGPTATTFSDLAASEENQRKFFRSLLSFLSTYDLDGVDIDWEYPAAEDRSGRPEDFKNLPKFMANLKGALKRTGGRDHLSITLPASYWYLQHFDVAELEKHVDYLNVMSYDLHGEWDKGNEWTGAYLYAHTNLTEIELALDLLWRNEIDPENVVLGLGFYSRAFTAESKSCMKPGCMFASGSDPGPCSDTTGVLLNSELEKIMRDKNIQPTLDKSAAVQILKWDDQWAPFDDEVTLKMKIEYARGRCLGGLMVWAVTQDTSDAKYSNVLKELSPRPFPALAKGTYDDSLIEREKIDQCFWTGCREKCPSGYFTPARSDKGARENEIMTDESGCDGDGFTTLCCPQDNKIHDCGWYTHNNGKCDGKCPSEMIEIGSNSMYCNSYGHWGGKTFQAACCNTEPDSMKLYTTSEWSPETIYCDNGNCNSGSEKNRLLVSSATGSGGSSCQLGLDGFQKRKLCYTIGNDDMLWDNCDWYSDKGKIAAGRDRDFCRPSCPKGTVRVAMDTRHEACRGGGAAHCCVPAYYKPPKRPEEQFRADLELYLETPDCWGDIYDDDEAKAEHQVQTTFASSDQILQAAIGRIVGTMSGLIEDRKWTPEEKSIEKTWSSVVGKEYPGLVGDKFFDYVENAPLREEFGITISFKKTFCQMERFNAILEGDEEETYPSCAVVNICHLPEDYCNPPDDRAAAGVAAWPKTIAVRDDRHALEKRRTPELKTVNLQCKGGNWLQSVIPCAAYPSSGEWPTNHTILQNAVEYMDESDCSNPFVRRVAVSTTSIYATEHIIELQTVPMFYEFLNTGMLSSGKPGSFQTWTCEDLQDVFFHQPVFEKTPASILAGSESDFLHYRFVDAFGSNSNNLNFHLLRAPINGMKAEVWKSHEDLPDSEESFTKTSKYAEGLALIRNVLAVWAYMNEPGIDTARQAIDVNIGAILLQAEAQFSAKYNVQIRLLQPWEVFIRDQMKRIKEKSERYVKKNITRMRKEWDKELAKNPKDKLAQMVVRQLKALEATRSILIP